MSMSFCTMGGMAMSSNGNGNTNGERRRLAQDISRKFDLPVIMSDDSTSTDGHDMHQMDHNSQDTDHDMDDMDHMDHSSHSMSGMSMGTIMYMDGFHSALFSSSDPPPQCLNLFNPNWTLDSKEKFVFAMFFIAMLGVLVEACAVWRVKCLRKGRNIRRRERLKRMQRSHNQQQPLTNDLSPADQSRSDKDPVICPAICRRVWRRYVPRFIQDLARKLFDTRDASKQINRCEIMAASLHATRALFGYLLMLAVMSYAIEFLFCTIVGMVLGRYWFIENEGDFVGAAGDASKQIPGNGNFNGSDGMWGGGDPCCGIDDDDEDFSVDNNMDASSEVETRLMRSEDASDVKEPLLGGSLSRRNVT
ncbi:hypothetical protein ACHAWO_009981 [Cyclotella atomus]|uniref:Copper transport protein n=1 Tax=Cyclotella atomus TaxID=382360 RepID=A0ABD3QQ07_9STRA